MRRQGCTYHRILLIRAANVNVVILECHIAYDHDCGFSRCKAIRCGQLGVGGHVALSRISPELVNQHLHAGEATIVAAFQKGQALMFVAINV